jgi:GTP-binding protein Era
LFLNSQIKSSYKTADATLLLVDLTRPFDNEDEKIISLIKEYKISNVILVLTKSDLSNSKKITAYQEKISGLIKLHTTIVVSSKQSTGLSELIDSIKQLLPIEERELVIEDNDNFTISEIIRRQVIFNLQQELPYATAVIIELNNYDKFTNTLNIQAVIVVEKESQKPIVIGKGGSMIKKIGTMSRKDLMNTYASKVNLKLFVKVKKE